MNEGRELRPGWLFRATAAQLGRTCPWRDAVRVEPRRLDFASARYPRNETQTHVPRRSAGHKRNDTRSAHGLLTRHGPRLVLMPTSTASLQPVGHVSVSVTSIRKGCEHSLRPVSTDVTLPTKKTRSERRKAEGDDVSFPPIRTSFIPLAHVLPTDMMRLRVLRRRRTSAAPSQHITTQFPAYCKRGDTAGGPGPPRLACALSHGMLSLVRTRVAPFQHAGQLPCGMRGRRSMSSALNACILKFCGWRREPGPAPSVPWACQDGPSLNGRLRSSVCARRPYATNHAQTYAARRSTQDVRTRWPPCTGLAQCRPRP